MDAETVRIARLVADATALNEAARKSLEATKDHIESSFARIDASRSLLAAVEQRLNSN